MKLGPLSSLSLALLAACGRHGGSIVNQGPDGPPPEMDAAAVPDRALPAIDAAGDLSLPDAAPALPAEQAYRGFFEDYNEAWRRRLVSCFNFPASSVSRDIYREPFDSVIQSLQAGLAGWDAAQAERCLKALATAPCEELANGRALAACDRVLTGRVPDDGFCLNDEDCREPGHVCGSSGLDQCGAACQRSLAPARTSAAEGQACPYRDCQSGLYCRESAMGAADGICRAIALGGSCDSNWQCPYPYTCVADVTGKGTCGVGRAAGQPCHVWTDRQGLDSDCNPDARCLPMGSGATVCVPEPPSSYPVEPVALPAGSPCTGDDTKARCVLGTFCRIDPAELQKDPPPMVFHGVCQILRKAGDACESEGTCVPGASCVNHVCTPCLGGIAPTAGGAPDAGAAGDGGCGAKLASDPANCGACGHGCQGGACFNGQCQPRAIGKGIDGEIHGLGVDDTGVYLTVSANGGTVLRVTSDGSQPIQVLATAQSQPEALVVDATHVYWVNFSGSVGGEVSRVPKAGGAVEVLAPAEAGPTQLAMDATHLYWVNTSEGPLQGVRRMPKAGGVPETLVPGIYPGGVALDATDFYWSDYMNGTVSRRAKVGGAAKVLTTGLDGPGRLALDDRRVYWVSAGHNGSVAKAGGSVTEYTMALQATDLAVDGDGFLYSATNLQIWREGGGEPLRLLESGGFHQIELRGPWIYLVTGQGSLVRIPK